MDWREGDCLPPPAAPAPVLSIPEPEVQAVSTVTLLAPPDPVSSVYCGEVAVTVQESQPPPTQEATDTQQQLLFEVRRILC